MIINKHLPLIIVAPVVFAIVFVSALIFSKIEPHVEDVDISYIMDHVMQPGYVLVDVRPQEIYNGKSPRKGIPGGHIPGAVSFPLSELGTSPAVPAALAKAGITKRSTIILYCDTGTTAERFADTLVRRLNFSASQIKHYGGSVREWVMIRGNKLVPEDHE